MRELMRFAAVCILLTPVLAYAKAAGQSGASGVTMTCDTCHTTGGTFSTTLAFTSPATTVAPSSVTNYTLLFSNTTSAANGVDVSATDSSGIARGTLGVVATTNGANLQVLNGEITHTTPKAASGSTVGWDFSWTAPATPMGCYQLNACADATNNDAGNAGDGPDSCIVQKVTVADGTAAAPTAVNDPYTGSATSPLTINAAQGVLANDTSVRCDPTAIKLTNPLYGTVTLNSDGSFVYTPGASATSYPSDSFTYKANDGVNDSAAATVTVNFSTSGSYTPPASGYGGAPSLALLAGFGLAGLARRRSINRL